VSTLLVAVALAAVFLTLAVLGVALISRYRRSHPYKVVGHAPSIGMTAVRWRDDPGRTHWLTLDHLAQQKGLHR